MNEITLKPGESVTIRAAEVVPPTEPPTQPPTEPPSGVSFQGDLQFSGQRVDSVGISDQIASWRIVIPAPLPDDWYGKIANVSVFENGNGTVWRHICLSRAMGDMSPSPPAAAANTGPYLTIGFHSPSDSCVQVVAGSVWYLNCKNELWTLFNSSPYIPTVGPPPANGNFGVKLYPPS